MSATLSPAHARSGVRDDEDRPTQRPARHRGAYSEMLICSVLSLIASLVLSIDAIVLAANPAAELSCNVSEEISCGAVAASWQANLFGFPNAFLGLIAEPVVITVAVAGLGGVRFPRWFMVAAQTMYTAGFVFAIWLFWQSYFYIGRLCPWCLLVTVTTTLVFASLTRINVLTGTFGGRVQRTLARPLALGLDTAAVAISIAVVTAMVIYRYV